MSRIEELIKKHCKQFIQDLGDIADSNVGFVIIHVITSDQLINSEFVINDTCERTRVEIGDWLALKEIIGEEETQIEKKFLEDSYMPEHELGNIENVGHAMLYCEGLYVYATTDHQEEY